MKNNKVLAKVADKEITEEDLQNFLVELGPQMAMQFQSEEGKKRLIMELVNQELLYLEAKEKKLEEDQEFKDLLDKTAENLLKGYAFTKLIKDEEVEDSEIKKYYDQNKESFKDSEKIQASHILVSDEDDAKDILSKLKAGEKFEDLAKEHSNCPSKEQGGDLGTFGKGQMVPEFENEAFKLEENEISNPVKTQFGYHIIKLVKKHPEKQKDLVEVYDEIKELLLRQKQQHKYLVKVNELSKKYEVKM